MFEVEQKFILTKEQEEKLLLRAEFVSEKKIMDEYFDSAEFSLTKNDMWLRKRGELFELKIPMHKNSQSLTQQYQEIEGEEKIREIFSLLPKNDFISDIKEFGYESFCQCITTRRKFRKEGFVIDLDLVEYDSGENFKIAEIEMMVSEKAQMEEAAEKIKKFALREGLEISLVHGKVLEYLKRKRPEHFDALVKAGVVRQK